MRFLKYCLSDFRFAFFLAICGGLLAIPFAYIFTRLWFTEPGVALIILFLPILIGLFLIFGHSLPSDELLHSRSRAVRTEVLAISISLSVVMFLLNFVVGVDRLVYWKEFCLICMLSAIILSGAVFFYEKPKVSKIDAVVIYFPVFLSLSIAGFYGGVFLNGFLDESKPMTVTRHVQDAYQVRRSYRGSTFYQKYVVVDGWEGTPERVEMEYHGSLSFQDISPQTMDAEITVFSGKLGYQWVKKISLRPASLQSLDTGSAPAHEHNRGGS